MNDYQGEGIVRESNLPLFDNSKKYSESLAIVDALKKPAKGMMKEKKVSISAIREWTTLYEKANGFEKMQLAATSKR